MWWKTASVYQIYPMSFLDSNGDGIGDLEGIMNRLDYIKDLGVDAIWLSPIFMSPLHDNGYDVSDFDAVHPLFGTKALLKQLVDAVHARGLKIITDIVLNHTSDQHVWFLDAINNPQSPYRDYYIFKDKPTSMRSLFGGSAWEYVPKLKQYYFHFFAKQQPDLNWKNPELRQALYAMLNRWIDFGFDGFRLDVIDLIGKDIDQEILANGPFYTSFLNELKTQVFTSDQLLTVGELAGSTPEQAARVTNYPKGTFSMAFQFSFLGLDEIKDQGKWALKPFDHEGFKQTLVHLHQTFFKKGWNALFMGNHDQPRALSRYGHEGVYRHQSMKMLWILFYSQLGTPFIYQGDEIGMINYPFTHFDQFKDIESLQYAAENLPIKPGSEIMTSLLAKSRDHARTPMQWDDSLHAGFTTGNPWLAVNPLKDIIHVDRDLRHPDSLYHFSKQLLQLRKRCPAILKGDLTLLKTEPKLIAYIRFAPEQRLLIIGNWQDKPVSNVFKTYKLQSVLLTNDPSINLLEMDVLPPYYAAIVEVGYGND